MSNHDYRILKDSLIEVDRKRLIEIYEKQLEIAKDIIDQNIDRDREHLRLVNFTAEPFLYNGTVHHETEYLLVAVEPLYSISVKNFDLAIFNQKSKVIILVECKSSISDVGKEINDLVLASSTADDKLKELENIVGSSIQVKEVAICVNAAYTRRVREFIAQKNLPICLWGADRASDMLFMEKQGEDTKIEIERGRIHHDAALAGLLLRGIKSQGLIRSIPFLPSSHTCTILEEIVPLLLLKAGEADRFHLSDLRNILMNESYLTNFDDRELWRLSESILEKAIQVDVLRYRSPTGDPKLAEFETVVRRSQIRDIRKKYTDFNSKRIAEEASLKEFEDLKKSKAAGNAKITDFK